MARKKRLYIDAGPLLTERLSGIGHLTLEMIRALLRREDVRRDYEIRLLAPIAKAFLLNRWRIDGVRITRVPLLARMWNMWPRLRFAPPVDIFLGKGVYIFTNYRCWPLAFSKSITYVHDISFELFPQFTEPRNLAMLANVPRWIAASDLVITDSQTSKDEIVSHYKLDEQKIRAIYCGVDKTAFRPVSQAEIDSVKKKYSISKPYLFFLSNLEPRKNIITLIRALYELPGTFKNKYALVMVGGMSWHTDDIVAEIDKARDAGWNIIKPSVYVPDQEIPALLSGAEMLVHPVLHEGFGIPPIEAMACGTPVIVSDIPVMHEVAGEAALYVDPHSPSDIANKIQLLATDKKLRQQLTSKGSMRAAMFTWDGAAEELMGYVNQCAPQSLGDSLRMILKNIDSKIVARIERLHVVKPRQRITPKAGAPYFDTSTTANLLSSIREADIRAYYSLKPRAQPPRFVTYHIVMAVYTSLRRVGSLVARPFRRPHG